MKRILLLGATGSIGQQSLDIIDKYNDEFVLTSFSVGHHHEVIEKLIEKYKSVTHIYLLDENKATYYQAKYPHIIFYSGKKGLIKLVKSASYDIAINALVGFVGAQPAIEIIKRNKILCLANKEALVTAGEIINKLLNKGKGKLYPIDSEHVALAKCLKNVNKDDVESLYLTASGGALRNVPIDQLKFKKAEDALKHPNWKMGDKITIDCATMMNKGFEIIEAYYLFSYPLNQIKVMMHDESLVHSFIKLKDGTYIVDYGKPDMHKCIEYAIKEGNVEDDVIHLKSLDELNDCHFHEYDEMRYPLTAFAKENIKYPSKLVALNAANEVAVNRYLHDNIFFTDIYTIVKRIVDNTKMKKHLSFNQIKNIDKIARKEALR